MSFFLTLIGIVILIAGTFVGIIMGVATGMWAPSMILIASGIMSGGLFLGFGKIIKLLQNLVDLKLEEMDTEEVINKTSENKTVEPSSEILKRPDYNTHFAPSPSTASKDANTKTCEKCGKILDENYAREWRYCEECRAKYFK